MRFKSSRSMVWDPRLLKRYFLSPFPPSPLCSHDFGVVLFSSPVFARFLSQFSFSFWFPYLLISESHVRGWLIFTA